jgi:hypothetical protein
LQTFLSLTLTFQFPFISTFKTLVITFIINQFKFIFIQLNLTAHSLSPSNFSLSLKWKEQLHILCYFVLHFFKIWDNPIQTFSIWIFLFLNFEIPWLSMSHPPTFRSRFCYQIQRRSHSIFEICLSFFCKSGSVKYIFVRSESYFVAAERECELNFFFYCYWFWFQFLYTKLLLCDFFFVWFNPSKPIRSIRRNRQTESVKTEAKFGSVWAVYLHP